MIAVIEVTKEQEGKNDGLKSRDLWIIHTEILTVRLIF